MWQLKHWPTTANQDARPNNQPDSANPTGYTGATGTLGGGGGILINNGSPVLENVTVSGNSAVYGAAVYVNNSTPTFSGCSFENNTPLTSNFTYAAKGHPHLSAPGELLISYIVNSHDFTELVSNSSIYRPQFISVNLDPIVTH
mgnify:CR=1 FL=1